MHFHLPRIPSVANVAHQVHEVIKHFKHEKESEAHQIFRQQVGHQPKGCFLPQTVNPDEETVPGIEHPGSTGVIYCSDRAMANGFSYANSHEWANLGQGAPEVGPIPNAHPRPDSISMPVDSLEYAPTTGVKALREAVADLYNHTYRQGKASQYTYENVCIVPGGRSGLSRVAAVVSDVYCSYQIPDYTAYDQVLSAFKRLVPVPTVPTSVLILCQNKYRLNIEQTKVCSSLVFPPLDAIDHDRQRDICTQGLAVIIASNPRNPTGQVIAGKDLKELVALSKEGTTVILDEFYSWYIYPEHERDLGKSISSAEYVDDVNTDPVVIIDGLTKVEHFRYPLPFAKRDPQNWRLPGWRVCWVIGPKNLITALSQSGSFLDGGANHPMQLAAISLLEPSHVAHEKRALQKHFKAKRDHVLKRLHDLKMDVDIPPQATFYIWLNLEKLPPPLNNGLTFFEELLKEKTIVIPGIFFDINPSHRRNLFNSPCHHFVRLSFGPPLEDLDKGLDAIERVVKAARKEGTRKFGHSYKKSLETSPEHV
ncbi:pyridoxal phosphate-dependent transferase [Chiua virens]|nr:pyridoxal phosphate-dependent transferase [Chiua virens]